MVTLEIRHVFFKDKDLDKKLKIWLDDVKKYVESVEGERVFIQTRVRQARDGDIRISTVISGK